MDEIIADNIKAILRNISIIAERCGRSTKDIKLMAVTKKVSPTRIIEALKTGACLVGENYVQEAREKIDLLGELGYSPEWHMIGHLQTRKAALAVRLFSMIQSLDGMELATELNRRAREAGCILKVLIQVNTGGEITKNGIAPGKAVDLAREIGKLENLSLEGLMTIPPWSEDPEESRPFFQSLRRIKEEIAAAAIPQVRMGELSMGMSDDYPIAVEEGATLVRIGRGIFGERR